MKPYTPELTEAEQARKDAFDLWESFKGQWRNRETGEIRTWHPMVEGMGNRIYQSARKRFIPGKRKGSGKL